MQIHFNQIKTGDVSGPFTVNSFSEFVQIVSNLDFSMGTRRIYINGPRSLSDFWFIAEMAVKDWKSLPKIREIWLNVYEYYIQLQTYEVLVCEGSELMHDMEL